jgi:hypothetical protein
VLPLLGDGGRFAHLPHGEKRIDAPDCRNRADRPEAATGPLGSRELIGAEFQLPDESARTRIAVVARVGCA